MDQVDQFAAEAVIFEERARNGTAQGETAAREGIVRLMRLYLAALELPADVNVDSGASAAVPRVSDEDWRGVYTACKRFPLDMYGEVIDPLPVPPQEPVIGSLADDIADIYRDVVNGLRAFRAGQRDQAVWEWRFHFGVHWGEHATGAIRALHCWLAGSKGL